MTAGTGTLRLIVWPGMPDDQALRQAAETIGVELELAVVSSNEDLERLLDEQGSWDLITPSDYLVEKLTATGRLAELDPDANLDRDRLAAWSRHPDYDPREEFSWPLAFGTTGLLHRPGLVPGLSTWREFFSPGEGVAVGLLAETREVVGAALIAAGRSANATDPDSLALAEAVLEGQRDSIGSISSDDFTGPVERGEVAVHQAWSGPASAAVRADPELGFTLPEEGALLWVTTAAIPDDAPRPAVSRAFLKALLDPRNLRLAVENNGYSTPDEETRRLLSADLCHDPVLFPPPEVIERCGRTEAIPAAAEKAYAAIWPDGAANTAGS